MAKLYFYYSAMNAGKTTHLLQSSHNYRERGMQTLILSSSLDNRFGQGVVKSRIGIESPSIIFNQQEDIFALVQKQKTVDCILVDEVQFLNKAQVYQLTEIVDKMNIPVLAYGLRTDFQGELFEGSQYLLAWADELRELKTICHTGKKATMGCALMIKAKPLNLELKYKSAVMNDMSPFRGQNINEYFTIKAASNLHKFPYH